MFFVSSLFLSQNPKESAMATNPPLTFSGITPDQFAQMALKAKESGIDLNGNTGTASKFGVEISWNYSPDSQQLTLQCLNTPFFVSPADVQAKLQSLVEQTISAL
jgi:hypothetical protein